MLSTHNNQYSIFSKLIVKFLVQFHVLVQLARDLKI